MAHKSLALAKITRPRLHNVLVRTRLFDAIDATLHRPVAWFTAQCGGSSRPPYQCQMRS